MNSNSLKVLCVSAFGVLAAAGLATSVAPANATTPSAGGASPSLPATITLVGTVRDFKARELAGGHPDFQRQPTAGFGHYMGMVADDLGSDGKPVFRGTGNKVSSNWRDSAGRNIIQPKRYIDARTGDRAGAVASSAGGALTSGEKFAQWFTDVPGVNSSKQLELTLVKSSTSNVYTFNDRTDPLYSNRGGFFPINGELFGNYSNWNKNFHFTFELNTEFQFKRGSGQVFTFTGDDDVWVFVDGKLVIDIGGVHGAVSQTVDLDRLNWLKDGETYKLHFFFCERHTSESNFRIDTTLQLRTVEAPQTSSLFD